MQILLRDLKEASSSLHKEVSHTALHGHFAAWLVTCKRMKFICKIISEIISACGNREINQASFKYRNHFTSLRSCRLPCTILLISIHFVNFCFHRMEFQHGVCLPVPQLASVCDRLRTALCLFCGSPHLYARKPAILAGGITFRTVFRFQSKLFLCLHHDLYITGINIVWWLWGISSSACVFCSNVLIKCLGWKTWWSLDDTQANSWHKHASSWSAWESLHSEYCF